MKDEIKTIVLRVNGEDAQRKLEELRKRIAYAEQAKEKLEKVASGGGEWSKKQAAEYARLGKEIDSCRNQLSRMRATGEEVGRTLDRLSGASVKELQRTLRTLQSTLNSGKVARGSREWEELTSAIRRTKGELSQVQSEQRALLASSEELSSWGSRWMGLSHVLQTGLGLYDRFVGKAREYVSVFAQMKEAESQVVKYTGLASDEVDSLNVAFEQMDTRTPRKHLNAFAGDAGRLGIQTRDLVLEFVQAADQINVALGADLGEDAVKQIGKLTQVFGDDRDKGLKGAMLSTGSVINELAQTSSASERYLVDFTARWAGVGAQAGFTQAQIMALGSVLDQNMVSQEKGATALQNVITALFRSPAEMARAAGLEVKGFTALLKKDANSALLTFVEALHRAGNMDVLAPMFAEMKLSGAGVTQTLSTLAKEIDKVRATQLQATQAFEAGTSVTSEFEKANSTVQAGLEKAQKRAHELGVELGRRLTPVFTKTLSAGMGFARVLLHLVDFVGRNVGLLVRLGVVLGTYAGAQALAVAWSKRRIIALATENALTAASTAIEKTGVGVTLLFSAAKAALTGNVVRATAALRLFNMTLASNPYTLALTALVGLGVALYSLFSATKQLTAEQEGLLSGQKKIREAREEATAATVKERLQIEHLNRVLHSQVYSYGERKAALDRLQQIVPSYHASLTKEGKLINDNTSAIQNYLKELDNKATAEALYEKLVLIKKRRIDQEQTLDRKQNNVRAVRAYMGENNISESEDVYFALEGRSRRLLTAKGIELKRQQEAVSAANHALKKTLAEEDELWKYVKRRGLNRNIDGLMGSGGGAQSVLPTDNLMTPMKGSVLSKSEKGKSAAAAEKQAVAKGLDEIDRLLKQRRVATLAEYAQGLIDVREYEEGLLQAEWDASQRRVLLYKQGSLERRRAEQEEMKARQALREQMDVWSLEEVRREGKEQQNVLEEQYARGLLSEKTYQIERNRLALETLDKIRKYHAQMGNEEDVLKSEKAYVTESNRQKEDAERAYQERLKQLRERFVKEDMEQLFAKEVAMLKEAYDEKLLKEEEYQLALSHLKAQHEQQQKHEQEQRNEKDGWDKGVKSAWESLPQSEFGTSIANIGKVLSARKRAFDEIEKLEKQGVVTHAQAEERKREISADKMGEVVQIASAAYATIGALMSNVTQLAQAGYEAEAAKVSQRYDAEIAAVGRSSTRGRLLEEKKEKELAEMKTRYNKRAMRMQMAQALAMIPVGAMNAYNSAVQTPIVGPVLAPIAAAAAVAAGMMQVATIKKQHEAQQAGYYDGGFTGGRNYRREAGVVHEGEFVANHRAVSNPSLMPLLRLIDHAQRTNRVASLTAEDVSRVLPVTTGGVSSGAPVVVSQGDERTAAAIEELNAQLARGIVSTVALSGPDGFERQWDRYRRLKK